MFQKFKEKSMTKFQPRGGSRIVETSRSSAYGGSEDVFYKTVSPAADVADVKSRLTDRTDHGELQELAKRIADVYRRVVAPHKGVTALSIEERRAIRDQILAAFSHTNGSPFPNDSFKPTPALIEPASLLAGLTDELEAPNTAKALTRATSASELTGTFAELRSQIDQVTKQINGLIDSRSSANRSTKFQPGGVEKSGSVNQELSKALANGKPATWE
jgi:hypothetical protein